MSHFVIVEYVVVILIISGALATATSVLAKDLIQIHMALKRLHKHFFPSE